MYRIALAAALLAACAPQAPAEVPTPAEALTVWTGPQGRCAEEAPAVDFQVMHVSEVQAVCKRADVVGCFFVDDTTPMIVLPLGGTAHYAAHELGHWLFACSGLGASDANHNDPLFISTVALIRSVHAHDR